MSDTGFKAGLRRELRQLGSRRMYILCMIVVPIGMALFFLSLLSEGLPMKAPTAIVDLDHSGLSRTIGRNLASQQLLDVSYDAESYDAAMEKVRRGEIFGFFLIPPHFQRDALSGRRPSLEYYTNLTYFIPGSLSFKGFKTQAVMTSGGLMRTTLVSLGMDADEVNSMMQPVIIDINALNNPWLNYNIYLAPSFVMASLALMIMLVTVFSITGEIKRGTSPQWLATCRGRLSTALLTKLLPQTAIFMAVGLFIVWLFFCYEHFPMNGSIWAIAGATLLMVVACQAFAVFVCSAVPNPRLAYSLCALFGILTFSFTGFSFPVPSMYGAIAIFSYTAPVRYWFLIYINEGLNGVDLYYSRYYFAALLLFPLLCWVLFPRLKKALLNPVYVP